MPQPRGCHRFGRALRIAAYRAAGLVVLPIALAPIAGAPAAAQTLTEAFAYAYNNNPQLLAQRAALRATDETVPQALANWRPTVNFSGSAGQSRGDVSVNGGRSQFNSFTQRSVDLQINQPIYR